MMVLSVETSRRRLTWAFLTILGVLITGAFLLFFYIYNAARPAIFDASPAPAANNFVRSIYSAAGVDLSSPNDVATAPGGDVYVADTGNARIVVFNRNGVYLRQFGSASQGLVAPTSIAVSSSRVYVIDSGTEKLLIYSRAGALLKELGFKEESPIGVTYTAIRGAEGRVVVTTKSGVAVANAEGTFGFAYINWGSGPAQMDNPASALLTFSKEATSTLYVCDTLNYRVQALTDLETSPTVKWVYGAPLPVSGALQYAGKDRKFGLPTGIALTSNGELAVVDGLSSEMVLLDARTGKYLRTASTMGNDDGQLYYPFGIGAGKGEIFVADKYNNRIEVFSDTPRAPASRQSPVPAWRVYAPWLLSLPLLFILLTLARQLFIHDPRYTLDLSFLEQVAADEEGGALLARLRKVRVPVQIEPAARRLLPPDLRIVSIATDEAALDALQSEDPRLDEFSAAAVLVAARTSSRDYFLVGDPSAADNPATAKPRHITPEEFLKMAQDKDQPNPTLAK